MDKLTQYRTYIRKIIEQYAVPNDRPERDVQIIFDTERDHYLYGDVGWDKQKRLWNFLYSH